MPNILDEIILKKREEVTQAKATKPLKFLEEDIRIAPPPRNVVTLLTSPGAPKPRVIAECKKQSPSRGIMVKDYDPARLAMAYERGGAAMISVLTDTTFFGGSLADLEAVRQHVGIPVLRKDFIVDEYQIYEARAAGADSFLLLSGVLAPKSLEHFIEVGRSLGMEPLVESHTVVELDEALTTTARIVGVNNRDLTNFQVDLATARALFERGRQSSSPRIMVCESGIKERRDIERMVEVGYQVFLVGEALVTASDPEAALALLLG